jgi:hypothetical protein
MTRFITRRKLAAAAGVTAVGLGGMIAYAAWTTSGSGSGTVSARSASALVVADGHVSNTLYPNGTADLVVTVNNPNAYNVNVTSIVQGALASGSATTAAISDNAGGCTASTVTYTPPAGGVNFVVGAGATYTVTLHNVISMSNGAEDACQGATFTVPVIANGASTAATPSATSGTF